MKYKIGDEVEFCVSGHSSVGGYRNGDRVIIFGFIENGLRPIYTFKGKKVGGYEDEIRLVKPKRLKHSDI
jgi:hypothetical protein